MHTRDYHGIFTYHIWSGKCADLLSDLPQFCWQHHWVVVGRCPNGAKECSARVRGRGSNSVYSILWTPANYCQSFWADMINKQKTMMLWEPRSLTKPTDFYTYPKVRCVWATTITITRKCFSRQFLFESVLGPGQQPGDKTCGVLCEAARTSAFTSTFPTAHS